MGVGLCLRVCGRGGRLSALSVRQPPAASACPEPQFSCATRAVDVAWDNDCVKHEEGLSSSQVSLRSSSFAHQLCVLFRFPLLQASEFSGLFLQLCNRVRLKIDSQIT